MSDKEKTKKQLLEEINEYRSKIIELKKVNSEYIQAREKLSEELLTTVIDSIDAVVYVADMETYELLFLNRFAKKIFTDVTGRTCWKTLQKGQRGPCDFCTNKYLLDADNKPKGEYKWEFNNTVTGQWFYIYNRAIKWIDGRIVRLEIALDITDKKRAEEELKQSEEKFRSIVDSTEDSIYMVDRKYRYLFINKNHMSRLGLSKDQYINRAFSDFHAPEETGLFIEKVNKVFKTGNSYQYEFKSFRDDMYFLQTFSPVRNPNNEITAVTVISKEITAFKNVEERLYSMTITDELTGLYNRRGFLTLSDQQLKLANRDNKKMFLMSSDLDYLKLINDNMGHKAGDRALINTANILKETFRESDIIARMGGDEFVALGMVTPYSGIETLTERLNENLNIHNALTTVPLEEISLSFGFAVYDPLQPCSIEELLTNADELMYMDKRRKR